MLSRQVLVAVQMGHMPQEDYPEAIQETITNFLQGIKA